MKIDPQQELKTVINASGLLSVVSVDGKGGFVEVLCKQVQGREKDWVAGIPVLLRWAESSETKLLIAKKYLLRDGALVFGWLLQFDCSSIAKLRTTVGYFTSVVLTLQAAKPEVKVAVPRPVSQGNSGQKKVELKVVSRRQDEDGKIYEETTMPLPHVSRDLNIPTKPVWSAQHGRFIGGHKGASFSNSSS